MATVLIFLQIIGAVVGWYCVKCIYVNPSARTARMFGANLLAAPILSIVFIILELIENFYETNIIFFMHPFCWVPIVYEIGFIIGAVGFCGGLIVTRLISMIIRD